MWGAYFCMSAYEHDVVDVIKVGAYICQQLFKSVSKFIAKQS